jgi:hypothetical protein
MKIEDVDQLAERIENSEGQGIDYCNLLHLANKAIEVLRADAWYPIEKAEELGLKDGRYVLLWSKKLYWVKGEWFNDQGWFVHGNGFVDDITHIKRIDPLES